MQVFALAAGSGNGTDANEVRIAEPIECGCRIWFAKRNKSKHHLVEPASKADANEVRMVEPIECG